MTNNIFNMVWSTPTPRGHAQRMKMLVNLKKKVNTSTIELNNKSLPLLIVVTTCILITNIFQRDPLDFFFFFYQQLLKSLQSFWSIFLLKMLNSSYLEEPYTHKQTPRELNLVSKLQLILRLHINLESKYKI